MGNILIVSVKDYKVHHPQRLARFLKGVRLLFLEGTGK